MNNICVSVASSDTIGPYKIPQRGQNYINSFYANKNNLIIKSIISNGVYGENLNKLYFMIKKNRTQIIFTSYYQLLHGNKKKFIKKLGKEIIHFALEGIVTKNIKELEKVFKEVDLFLKLKYIKTNKFNKYIELYKKFNII